MTTLFDVMRSELIQAGLNEFVDEQGNLIFFNEDHQFMGKIFSYDEQVAKIVDKLFTGYGLDDPEFDTHFKKGFLFRFLNRRIGRQTVDSFRMSLLSTFLTNQRYINHIYQDLDKYIHQQQDATSMTDQINNQTNDGTSLTDNRSAFANLPQNNVQLDVDNTIMTTADDNTVSRNKQTNTQETNGRSTANTNSESRSYQLEQLFKTQGLEGQIYDEFDKKCFNQLW